MAKKRSTPTPGSGQDSKRQPDRALPNDAQVRERDRRRAAQGLRNADPTTGAVDRPKPSKAKREVDRLESEIRSWLLASLEPVAEPDDDTVSAGESGDAGLAAPMPALRIETEQEPEDTVVTPATATPATAKPATAKPATSDLEPGRPPGDSPHQIDEAPALDEPRQLAPVEQRARKNGVRPTAAPEASPSVAPMPVRHPETAIPSAPYQPPSWVAKALVDSPREDVVRRAPPARAASPQTDTKRQPRRRGLVVGVVVLLVTVLALAAIVWQIISIGRGNDTTSTAAGSGATQAAFGLQSATTITHKGGLVGVTHLLLDHPVPSLTVKVRTPAPGTSTADFDPTIRQLTMTVDGKPTTTLGRVLHSGNKVTLDLPRGAYAVDLMYRATGVFALSHPSIQGRGMVLLTPMIVAPASNMYSSISVLSSEVTNLGCSIAGASLTPCGTETLHGWRVTAPGDQGSVNVLAQFTLPGA